MGKRARRRQRGQARSTTIAALPIGVRRPDGPTARLQGLVERRNELEGKIEEETDRLAATGVGWPAIAAALGLSRQGARQASLRRQERARQQQLSPVSMRDKCVS